MKRKKVHLDEELGRVDSILHAAMRLEDDGPHGRFLEWGKDMAKAVIELHEAVTALRSAAVGKSRKADQKAAERTLSIWRTRNERVGQDATGF